MNKENFQWYFTPGKVTIKAYHAKMNSEFHSNTDGEYQSDRWDCTELDASETQEPKQLNSGHCQNNNLKIIVNASIKTRFHAEFRNNLLIYIILIYVKGNLTG